MKPVSKISPEDKKRSIMPRHSSRGGVVLVPPETVWPAIDALREGKGRDPEIVRWMPNIQLLFPFVMPRQFAEHLARLSELCQQHAPFSIRLAEIRFFTHPNGRATLWLAPEPAEPIQRLRADLEAMYPELVRRKRFKDGFVPHLQVARAPTLYAAKRLVRKLQPEWTPIDFDLTDVCLVGRTSNGPFQVRHRLPLGG